METKLKPYMLYDGWPEDGAVLAFAHTAKEARKEFAGVVSDFTGAEYIDVRAKRLWDGEHLYTEGSREKLMNNIPHFVDDPVACHGCELWGYVLNGGGYCSACEYESEAKDE